MYTSQSIRNQQLPGASGIPCKSAVKSLPLFCQLLPISLPQDISCLLFKMQFLFNDVVTKKEIIRKKVSISVTLIRNQFRKAFLATVHYVLAVQTSEFRLLDTAFFCSQIELLGLGVPLCV